MDLLSALRERGHFAIERRFSHIEREYDEEQARARAEPKPQRVAQVSLLPPLRSGQADKPYRLFRHPDGREWQIRVVAYDVELRVLCDDGEWMERRRRHRDSVAAHKELNELIVEQEAAGFVRVDPPPDPAHSV